MQFVHYTLASLVFVRKNMFNGEPGVIISISLYLIIFRLWYYHAAEDAYAFDPGNRSGRFKIFLDAYFDIAKLVIGLASGSIALIVSVSALHSGGKISPDYASPLFLLVSSIIYGMLFIILITVDYESYSHKTADYTREKYARNHALGYGGIISFFASYIWLIVTVTN